MLGGRVAWNVVTSLNDSEAHNMGRAEHPEHDLRYDRAEEFMQIVLSLSLIHISEPTRPY